MNLPRVWKYYRNWQTVWSKRRDDLMAAEAEDIGTPCTAVAMEVDMAVAHLRTMALEVP